MPFRYVPIVRTKAGEAQALGELAAAAKGRIFPLVVMNKTVPATFLPNMIQHLAGFPIALNGAYNHSLSGSTAAYTALFHGLGNSGIPVIPSMSVNADPNYLAAAAALVGTYGVGAVVSVPLVDIANALPFVLASGGAPSDVDLIVQIGDVAQHDPGAFGAYVSHALLAAFSAGSPWRSVSLNSYSAPRDLSNLPQGRSLVPRRGWQIWKLVAPTVGIQVDFSDWGHVHASLDDVPGYAMANATVSVRYPIDDYWIVRKGTQTSGPNGQVMALQYRNHAIALVNEPLFGAVSGCWGDARIQHYATTTSGTGGRGQWAAVLLNRHLSLVAHDLP